MPAWTWIVVVAAVLMLTPLYRLALAFLFGGRISERVLAKQPDAITLEPDEQGAWSHNPDWTAALAELATLGFEDAGTYTVREVKGVVLRLLAHAGEDAYATLYEHPIGGRWMTFTTYYLDGGRAQFTTMRRTGLTPRPGDHVVHDADARPGELFARMCRERRGEARLGASVAQAVPIYEDAFARDMAWRKTVGISRAEVVQVAARRKAA